MQYGLNTYIVHSDSIEYGFAFRVSNFDAVEYKLKNLSTIQRPKNVNNITYRSFEHQTFSIEHVVF